MTLWLIAAGIGLAAALLQYARLSAPSAARRVALAALRALAITLAVALVLNAPIGASRQVLPWVAIDASSSMSRGGATLWRAAWDSSASVAAESVFVFGDSLRRGATEAEPVDRSSNIRPVVERTMAAGRPVVLVTDGEIGDPAILEGLASGSRVIVLPRESRRDAALVSLDAPQAAVEGDTIELRVGLASAGRGAGAGAVAIWLDQRLLRRLNVESMSAWSERQIEVRVQAVAGTAPTGGPSVLRAIVSTAGDAEPRNDTVAVSLEISRAASAVFVSSSPDQDARYALAVLRGTLALPTRGYLRVAPFTWRHEGSLTPASEGDVRQALREAPIAIIHGDTNIFGAPRAATRGPLALIVPPENESGEWYVSAVPPSPLGSALASLPLDSLPPVTAGQPARGEWTALEARRGREDVRRSVIVGQDAPRRSITITASGFWRWRFRGGVGVDAHSALWGGLFDWLAAERADRRSALPVEGVVRAGQPIRWRRGASSDTLVQVTLRERTSARVDSFTLHFTGGVSQREMPPLSPGIYDVTVPGGRSILAVNAPAELLPARPTVRSGRVGRGASVADPPRARSAGFLYVLLVVLLCGEWIARRRAGLR